ncbi:MAG: hypothetical protein JXR70_03655 [Spirochaetales bacterium]|nr:hypothetical protein [Spirochaetales bacterium]
MKIVRKESDSAIRDIKFIQCSSLKIVPVSLIEKELSVSKAFPRKILQVLSKNSVLDSHRGSGEAALVYHLKHPE